MIELKVKNWREIKVGFERVVNPIQTEPEKAFINAIGTINQADILFSIHQQSLANHPERCQASGQEQAAQANRIREMIL